MLRRLLLVMSCILCAEISAAQTITPYIFDTLPASPPAGAIAWISDGRGTATPGAPAVGGGTNRDLLTYDASQARWEFVARIPLDATQIGYDNVVSGGAADDVQAALDELFEKAFDDTGATQPEPSVFTMSKATGATITNPSVTSFARGVQFGSTSGSDSFAAETYPGSGVPIREVNNQEGFAYNKTGLDGSVIDPFEHAFDDSWELSYRSTGGSNGNTWVERNWDFTPPDQRSIVSGAEGFDPAVGSYVTFPDGAGVVLAWNSATGILDWRQHSGTAAAGQTVTGTGGTKTLGVIWQIGYQSAFRPFLFTWDSALNRSTWEFRTIPPSQGGRTTLKAQIGKVGVNTDNQIASQFEVHGANSGNGYPVVWFEFLGSLHSTTIAGEGNASATGGWVAMNYAGLHNHVATVDYGKGWVIRSPAMPPSANSVYEHVALEVEDQRGIGSKHNAALRIAAQTNAGALATNGMEGNVELLGFDWNNGHIVAGGVGDLGDHLMRDQATERWRTTTDHAPTNSSDGRWIAEVVALGTRAMSPAAIDAESCSVADANISAPGAVTTDVVQYSPNGDPGPNGGRLVYSAWAGAGVISFRVCNPSTSAITPGSVSMNWRVVR